MGEQGGVVGGGGKDEAAQASARRRSTPEDPNGPGVGQASGTSPSQRSGGRLMSREPAFWDASGIVPLCVHESTSRRAQSELRQFLPVVWWASTVEVHNAITRLHRLGRLRDSEKKGALYRLDALGQGWREIPTDSLRGLATDWLDKYELRAADRLQLAAALIWCQQRPARRTSICADQRLAKSAMAAGFSVVELS